MWLANSQRTKCSAPVTGCLGLNGMDVSITHLTLPIYIDLDSIMELTYPVSLKFFENIKNNKTGLLLTFTHWNALAFLVTLLEASGQTWKNAGKMV